MRVVLDTNVVLTGLRSATGASAALLRAVRRKQVRLLSTVPLFLEYEEVLTRPEQLSASGLSTGDVEAVLDELARHVEAVEPFFLWRPQLRDADDDMVLECAINGRADALVTYNVRDFADAAPRFGLAILQPVDVLRRLFP
jgi:putative PIN family toxin of toxin-antitoxin system